MGPLVAILNAIAEQQPQRRVTWIHGCRNAVPFATRLTVLKRRGALLQTCIFKTVLQAGDIAGVTYDYNTRVNLAKVPADLLHTGNGSAEYYICGPEAFMKAVMQQLIDMGVSNKRIKTELFSVGEMKLDSVCPMTPVNGTPMSSPAASIGMFPFFSFFFSSSLFPADLLFTDPVTECTIVHMWWGCT